MNKFGEKFLSRRFIIKILSYLLIIPIVSIGFYFLGEGILKFLATQVFFPVEKEYLFTYDKNFDCKTVKDPKIEKICQVLSEIKRDVSEEGEELIIHKLGIFGNNFIQFIDGEKRTRFYYSKDLNSKDLNKYNQNLSDKQPFSSFMDRLRFYFWWKSLYQANAYSIPFFNIIVLGSDFFTFHAPRENSTTIIHEILHLCYATEDEIDLLTGGRSSL